MHERATSRVTSSELTSVTLPSVQATADTVSESAGEWLSALTISLLAYSGIRLCGKVENWRARHPCLSLSLCHPL